jgi:hypothetical protein
MIGIRGKHRYFIRIAIKTMTLTRDLLLGSMCPNTWTGPTREKRVAISSISKRTTVLYACLVGVSIDARRFFSRYGLTRAFSVGNTIVVVVVCLFILREKALDFDHTLFLPIHRPPHAFQFFVRSLHGDFIFRLVFIGDKFDRNIVDAVTGPPIVQARVGR